jgi:hypothetical protein
MRFRINGTDTLFINSSNNLKVPDDSRFQFGGSLNTGDGDLQIFHDSSTNFNHIQSSTGNNLRIRQLQNGAGLYLAATHIYLQNHNNNQTYLHAQNGGSVTLNYSGNNRARTDANGFYLERVNTFSNPNNTGSETLGAMLDIGGNIHLQEVHPVGAYTDRCDLVINTNSGYGLGLSDKIRITAGGRVCIYSSTNRSYNKGWTPGNLVLANNSADGTVDFTQGILFTDNANNDSAGGWMHAGIVCTGSSGYNGNMIFGTDGNGSSNNNVSGLTEKMRLTDIGDLCLNQTTNDTRLGIKAHSTNTNKEFITCRDTSSNLKFYIHHSGAVYNSGGSYGNISDVSLKENIVDANSQWNDIKNIKIRNFNFTEASGYETHTQIGCVAQEVETVSPKLVDSSGKDGIKSVASSVLYMKAVKALQESMARIETLEAKVAALEGS